MLGLKCLLDRVLLRDVVDGGVLTLNAMLTLHTLESFWNCLGEQHPPEGLSQLCLLKQCLVGAPWSMKVKSHMLAQIANMEVR